MQDGEILMSSSRVHVDAVAGVLYFTPLHKDDEGSYNCTAFNDVGTASSSSQLRVYGMVDMIKVFDFVSLNIQHFSVVLY